MHGSPASRLDALHADVHRCTRCFEIPGARVGPDGEREHRKLPGAVLGSAVIVVGEALGPSTQRLTGLPYIRPDGTLSRTGKTLDEFASQFGYTIDPGGDGRYLYATDIVRCLPRDAHGKPCAPTRLEADNCAPFLEREIEILRPAVVVLMGVKAASTFLRRFMRMRMTTLAEVVGGPHSATVAGIDLAVFVVPHPSPLAARPGRAMIYRDVAEQIVRSLP